MIPYNSQASAEQFEDRLKGLLDQADQADQADGRRPAGKRRKLDNPGLGDYNQAYDEVMIVVIVVIVFMVTIMRC